ncbi:MAG TPA: tyrosine-type recombinase/integrase [Anaerolineales bacterium]|nr:tyrosine-type recombinase/integrase [Anaerolineales bacterium]
MSPENNPLTHITAQAPILPAVNAWRIYLNDQGKSPHTVKAFTADVLLLAGFLAPDRPLGEISTNELNLFLQWMQNTRDVPCSPKTFARRITSLKAFFRWLHQYGVILVDPAERVVQHSVVSPLPQVLTADEVEAVLAAAEKSRRAQPSDARPLALVTLLLNTGIKKSECLAISPNHIDFEAPEGPILFVRYASPQHRYKERKITLPENWAEIYNEYKGQYPISDRLFPWSPRRLEYLLEDLGEAAGLSKHLSFDMCRWTCALSDWQSDVDPNKVRQKLGISKIQWREVKMKLERLSVS